MNPLLPTPRADLSYPAARPALGRHFLEEVSSIFTLLGEDLCGQAAFMEPVFHHEVLLFSLLFHSWLKRYANTETH